MKDYSFHGSSVKSLFEKLLADSSIDFVGDHVSSMTVKYYIYDGGRVVGVAWFSINTHTLTLRVLENNSKLERIVKTLQTLQHEGGLR